MKSNAGSLDRILRALMGVLLLALTVTGTIGLWGWIGVVSLGHSRRRCLPAVLD